MFMGVRLGFTLWVALIISAVASCGYLLLKPFLITRDTYAVMAVASCVSLSIVAGHFLWIALGIDLVNMVWFLIAMLIFSVLIAVGLKYNGSRKKRKRKKPRKKDDWLKYLRIVGWGFLGFLFFYQLVLSYLLRPNFLTVMALAISHFNLLLIIWTYFDIGRLYGNSSKNRDFVVK
jgi:uncharacterized membrane protein